MANLLDFSKPRVLRSDEEYRAAIDEIERLLDTGAEQGTEAYDRLEFLSVLVEVYEREHEPLDSGRVSPQDVVNFMLDQKGWDRSDLADLLGGKSRVSEFFSGKRSLSINQIRALRNALGIPADLLIRPDPEESLDPSG